eukprot:456675-Pyramimonas_sp.AAC.1
MDARQGPLRPDAVWGAAGFRAKLRAPGTADAIMLSSPHLRGLGEVRSLIASRTTWRAGTGTGFAPWELRPLIWEGPCGKHPSAN